MASPAGEDSSGSVLKDLVVNQYQAILLFGAAALSVVMLSPVPLIVLLGGELVTLPVLDSVPALRRLVHRRRRAAGRKEADARQSELIASLNPGAAKRYRTMENLCSLIETNYQGLHGISQVYLAEQGDKLDVILEGCLHRMVALQRYERVLHLRSTASVEQEIAEVEQELKQPQLPERARAAMKKNLELKQKLLKSMVEARGTRKALELELDSMESLLEVLHQNSISLRDPQAISQELDTIVRQSEDSERAVREMEALMGGLSVEGPSATDRTSDRAAESSTASTRRMKER